MSPAKRSTKPSRGAAGRRGEGIRSDLWVSVETRRSGGLKLQLTSRVELYYGEAIREQVA
jgi:citrate lyase gamma subunit